ncbi:MAG: CPBP family intramembrane metalloprotease [Pirellulaceae bacterium]|nr:CPBP family intramembrane metalloprotease [Pirellulaceae bacterium]
MTSPFLQSRLLRLCQKELKETIRDRRTIVTLLLMPLLVYPLLSMSLNRFLLTSAAGDADAVVTYKIGVMSESEGMQLQKWLDDPLSAPPDPILEAGDGSVAQFEILVTAPTTVEEALDDNGIDIGAVIDNDQPPVVTFIAYAGDGASQSCQRILIERMQWLRMRSAEITAATGDPTYLPPARVNVRDVGEPQQASLLATIVPLVLVLMTITGAVYPAIDLTAGERERGTMESLMASPVPRFSVLFAKYIAVVTVALLTALANLLAMFTTLWASRLLPILTGGTEGIPWLAILHILGLLVLFSGFFSAVLLSLTSFAKSFKEAQAYLIPVMLLSLTPGMLSLMPGIKLSGAMAIAPLVNIVILARDLLAGNVDPPAALAAIVSTIAYAAAALAVAAKLFGSDAVTRTSEQSIGSLFRRPQLATDVPGPQSAALMLALLVPIYFVVSNSLLRLVESFRESLTISNQLCLNAVALIATFGVVPLAATYLGRSRYRSTYRLNAPGFLAVIGAFLIGCGAWSIAHEAFLLAEQMGIGGLDEERIRKTLQTLEAFTQAPPLLLIATLALTPAVIEELCFRGFLFSSLSKVLSPARVIVITSVIFGLFHVLTGNALLVERFIPTTLLGLILGWIAHRTGSVLPGMLMHFVHNALLELVAHYHKELEFLGEGFEDQTHLPPWLLISSASIAVVGMLIVYLATRKRFRGDVKQAD